jgi:predicted cytidylate kinase
LLITISGLPGAGTSTVARAVADRLGLERLDGGAVFRTMAADRNLSLAAFGAIAEGDPAFDLELDSRLAERAHQGDVVLESRLAGWIATNEGLPAVRVWVTCDDDERARRVAARDGGSAEAAARTNEAREASEAARYRAYYGIDLDDRSIYELVLDSTTTPPGKLVDAIVEAASRCES